MGSAASSRRTSADSVLFLCHDWELRDCILAAHDFEAPLRAERFKSHAHGCAALCGRIRYAAGEWLALRLHARAPLARRGACICLWIGSRVRGSLSGKPGTVA